MTFSLQVTSFFVGLTNHFAFFFFFQSGKSMCPVILVINLGWFFFFCSLVYDYFLYMHHGHLKRLWVFVVAEKMWKLIDLSFYIFQRYYMHSILYLQEFCGRQAWEALCWVGKELK